MQTTLVRASSALRFTIRVSVRGGLGNRILGVLSGLIVSEALGSELEIIWEPDAHCPAPFDALFEPIGVEISSEKVEDSSWPQKSFPTREFFETASKTSKVVKIRPSETFGEDLFAGNVFGEKLREKLPILRPVKAVADLMRTMPKSTIGMHVRMTDHLPCQMLTPKWCYKQVVQEATKGRIQEPVLVCSDTPEFFEELQRMPMANIVRLTSPFTNSKTSRGSVESIRYALADLLLLARCEIILASNFSSFARVAHMIGRNEFHVLNGLPHILRSKQSQFAWWIAQGCELDPHRETWVGRKRVGSAPSVLAVACAQFITHRFYQRLPMPIVNSRNRTYLKNIFQVVSKASQPATTK